MLNYSFHIINITTDSDTNENKYALFQYFLNAALKYAVQKVFHVVLNVLIKSNF